MPYGLNEYLQKKITEIEKCNQEYKTNKLNSNQFSIAKFIEILQALEKQTSLPTFWPQSILLVSLNYPDGLGDFVNLLDLSQTIKAIAPSEVKIKTLAIVTENKAGLIKFIAEGRERNDCEFIIIPDDINITRTGQLSFKALKIIKNYCEKNPEKFNDIELIFNISSISDDLIFILKKNCSNNFNKEVASFTLAEFSKSKANDKNFIAMGLANSEVGIRTINELSSRSSDDMGDKLLSFSEQTILKKILGADSLEFKSTDLKELAKNYLQNTELRFGIFKSLWPAILFIQMIAVEFKVSHKKQLDFFIITDLIKFEDLPLGFLADNNVGKICFYQNNELFKDLTLNHTKTSASLKAIRIFCIDKVLPTDLLIFQELSSPMLGGAGDNSVLDSIFKSNIPFFEVLSWKKKFMSDLLRLVYLKCGNGALLEYFLCMSFRAFAEIYIGDEISLRNQLALHMGNLLIKKCDELTLSMQLLTDELRKNYNVNQKLEYVIRYAALSQDYFYKLLEDFLSKYITDSANYGDKTVALLQKTLIIISSNFYLLSNTNNTNEFVSAVVKNHLNYSEQYLNALTQLASCIVHSYKSKFLSNEMKQALIVLAECAKSTNYSFISKMTLGGVINVKTQMQLEENITCFPGNSYAYS